ncbi:hypothetical protein R1flu_028541 [Riccia fluitans]|uniref:Uncharacterized protein n=1 Tax=Riccia fluitans TaxID=41844 RepID=A0ABD1XLZ8_9MARC
MTAEPGLNLDDGFHAAPSQVWQRAAGDVKVKSNRGLSKPGKVLRGRRGPGVWQDWTLTDLFGKTIFLSLVANTQIVGKGAVVGTVQPHTASRHS